MTDSIYAWSQTSADNATADATINWAEFQTPSSVNDSARALMARVAALISDQAPKRSSTGTGNAYAVTSDAAGISLRDGEQIAFIPDRSNTAACTLNVDGRGAKAWGPAPGVSFSADNILAGVPVTAYYRSSTDEWISPGTGYYVTNIASGVALQSITARLPQIGDMVISLDSSPGAGRIRLTESTQSILKTAYPELNSWLSDRSYPWGSTATHFSLPPAAGYFLRFAATTSSIDTSGARTAGSTQSDQNKTASIPASGLTASSSTTSTLTINGGTPLYGGPGGASWGADGGGVSGPAGGITAIAGTVASSTATTLGGSATLSGGDEVRAKNVAFHVDIIASTALAAAQVAVFGFPFQWDTDTAASNPGAGRVRGDNATLSSITNLYISNEDGWGVDLTGIYADLAAGNAISLSKVGAGATRIVAELSGSPVAGSGFYTIPVTIQASSGTLSSNDQLAMEYGKGSVGAVGATGPNTGLDFAWSTANSGDPGSGKVLANNATLASATAIHISKTDRNGASLGTVIGLWDDSTSSIKGHGRIFTVADRTEWIEYDVTSLTDNSTYWTVAISNVAGNGTPTANDVMCVMFEAKGDKGDTGGVDITILTDLEEFDPTTDEMIVYDASAGTNKAVLLSQTARYGCDLTGATDSSTAFQTLVDSGFDVIRLDGGVTIKLAGINITQPVTIIGAGKTYPGGTSASSSFVANDNTTDMFTVNSNSVRFAHVDIRGTGSRSTTANASAKVARGIVVGSVSRNVTGTINATSQTFAASGGAGSFTSSDVGARIHIPGAYNGTSTPTISAVAGDGSSATVSAAADNTASGVSATVAHVRRDFVMEHCSSHSHSIGLDLRNASNVRIVGNELHGAYGMYLGCEVAADIGDSFFSGNEYNSIGGSGSKAVYHTSQGSPRFIGDKFQTAEIQYHCNWSFGTSGGPQFIGCIFENASATHMQFQDDGSGSYVLANTVITGCIFNGAPTTGIAISDAGGTGWMQGLTIVGNRITSATATTFISIGKAAHGAMIAGNTLHDTATGSASTGISIASGADDINVAPSNFFHDISSPVSNSSATSRVHEIRLKQRALTVTNEADSASVQVAAFQGDRATPTNGDAAFVSFLMSNSAGTQVEFARETANASNVTAGAEAGGITWSVISGGSLSNELFLNSAQLSPVSNDGLALGAGSAAFSDLFLASGGVINFANGDVLATHSSDALAFSGASSGYSFDATVKPASNDGAALGVSGTAFSDLFLAAGGVVNWNSGSVVVTEASGKLTVSGGNLEIFEMNGGTALTVGRVKSAGAAAYLAFQNTGGTAASTLMGVAGGGDFELQAAAGKGLTVKKAGGVYTYVRSSEVQACYDTAIPAGGTAGKGLMVSTTSNFGVFFGSGAPTLSAAQGSLYLRSDGSSTSTRLYVNTNGSTGWTNVTTAT